MNTKKLLAILLCLTVMIGLFCVVVSAAEGTAPESAPAGNKDILPKQKSLPSPAPRLPFWARRLP